MQSDDNGFYNHKTQKLKKSSKMNFLRVGSCDAVVFYLFYNEERWITVPWQAGKIKVVSVPLPNGTEPVKKSSQ